MLRDYIMREEPEDESQRSHPVVQSVKSTVKPYLQQSLDAMKSVPFRRKDSPLLAKREGKPFKPTLPYDHDRRYDNAIFQIHDHQNRKQVRGPLFATVDPTKRGSAGPYTTCVDDEDNSLLSWMLGFAYGLQYDYRKDGKCVINLSNSLTAFTLIFDELILILFPEKWAQLTLEL